MASDPIRHFAFGFATAISLLFCFNKLSSLLHSQYQHTVSVATQTQVQPKNGPKKMRKKPSKQSSKGTEPRNHKRRATPQTEEQKQRYKLVLLVRHDLKMGVGKVGAQCGHASLMAWRQAVEKDPEGANIYLSHNQRKICLRVGNEDQL